MANTNVQRVVESWVRDVWLPKELGVEFEERQLRLSAGGLYRFNAVSADRSVAVAISTSAAATASGRSGVGTLLKGRSDVLYLLMAKVQRRVVVFTEKDMCRLCLDEQERGRIPQEIEFLWAEIPAELDERLKFARRAASIEVSPTTRVAPTH